MKTLIKSKNSLNTEEVSSGAGLKSFSKLLQLVEGAQYRQPFAHLVGSEESLRKVTTLAEDKTLDSHEVLEGYGVSRLNVNSRKLMERVQKPSEATSKTDT